MWITTILSVFTNNKNIFKYISIGIGILTVLYFYNDYSNLKESKIKLNKEIVVKQSTINSLNNSIKEFQKEKTKLENYYIQELKTQELINNNVNIVIKKANQKTKILYRTIYKDRVVYNKEKPGENLVNLFNNLRGEKK